MTIQLMPRGAGRDDLELNWAALEGPDWDEAYQAASLAGHAVVALAGGLAIDHVEPAVRLSPASEGYRMGGVHLTPDDWAPTARLHAWAAGTVAAELFCGATGDTYGTAAFHDAFNYMADRGDLDPDDDAAVEAFPWEEARLAARATLERPGPRRATLAIAARLLEPDVAVLSGAEVGRLYAEALRRAPA